MAWVKAVDGPYLRLELSDSSCILFSTELSLKTCLIFYLADFQGKNWRIAGFYEKKTQHWALFSTKTNQGRFYFHWALLLKSSRRHKLSSELGLKVGFKELQLEFLNRWLW